MLYAAVISFATFLRLITSQWFHQECHPAKIVPVTPKYIPCYRRGGRVQSPLIGSAHHECLFFICKCSCKYQQKKQ